METLGGSGDCASNHLSGTANNMKVPLDLRCNERPTALKGPTAFECDWTHLSQRVLISNGQILACHQNDNESCLRQSMLSAHGQTEKNRYPGSTTSLLRENNPLRDSKHFSSNDRLPVTSGTRKKLLLPKGPVQLCSSSFKHQNASSALMTKNMTLQSMPHTSVVNSNNLNENWKNSLSSQQQHVKIVNSLPMDSICQGLFTDVGHVGVILAPTPSIRLCQQSACMSKDAHQQKLMSQKAIAVVTPLTQDAMAGIPFSNNLNKVKEGVIETRFRPNKNDHQPYISQSAENEGLVKTLSDNTSQTKGAASKSALATHCVVGEGPAENGTFPGQSPRSSSTSLNSVSTETKETAPAYTTIDDGNSECLQEDDPTIKCRNNEGTDTTMNVGLDKLSAISVNEWTLQRLRNLVTDLEQIQKRQQKKLPFDNLSREILQLYWNGNSKKLSSAAKSDLYINIMKDVRRHCGTGNSVIFQAVSKGIINEVASTFHILEHGMAPPKMGYTSSWLNLSEELCDLDGEHDSLSSLVTLQPEPKIADKEAPGKEMENIQEPSNEKVKVSVEALRGEEEPRKPSSPVHQKSSSVKGDTIAQKERDVMTVENTCSVTEIEGQVRIAVNNVIVKGVQSEKQNKTKGENEAPLRMFLATQSSDVSESCMTPGNLLPTTDLPQTPVMGKDGSADCISEEMSVLPPEKDRSLVPGEPGEEVNNRLKADAQILTSSRSPSSVELFDPGKKVTGTEIKSDERSSRMRINSQVETYCCLAKWFQILGYRNGGHCKCEERAELSHHADTSGKGVKKEKADKARHSFKKLCKLTDTETSVLRDKRRAKKRLGYRNMAEEKSVTSPIDDEDSSMDEIKIVDVITNSEDVLKLANTMSEQLMETPRASTSLESTSVRKHCTHKEITTAEFKTGDALINLELFGTSHLRQKKKISVFTSSDTVHLPPETIDVRMDSGWNECCNSAKSQTSKQHFWNSWKKTHMPLKIDTKGKSKNLKHAKAPELRNDAAETSVVKTAAFDQSTTLPSCEDVQTRRFEASAGKQRNAQTSHSKKKIRRKKTFTRKDQIRKMKRNKIFSLFNLKRWNYANGASKPMKASFHPAQAVTTSKPKLNPGSALNFSVLPESFNISDGTSSIEVNQSARADSITKVQPVVQVKRPWNMSGTWYISPRKKKCLKLPPAVPNTSGTSAFQEFKKKYEEKKQRIPM